MLQARRKPWQDDCVGTKARSSRYSQHKKTILGSFSRLLSCCSCDQGREDVDRIGSGIRCPSVTGRCLLANTEKRTRSSNGANKCVRARPGCRRSPETDAPDRQAAHGIPMRGRPAVAGSAGPGSLQGRAVARCHADGVDGSSGTGSSAPAREALYREPLTIKPDPGHKIIP